MKFFQRKKRVHILIIMAMTLSFLFIHIASAVTAEPGTPEDPIVSQSYVDSKIADITGEINSLKQQIQNSQPSQGGKFEVIGPIQPGQRIIAGESTEIVLRGGAATAIASNNGGVADLITGTDLSTGANVPLNHLLLIPRNDGRGLTVTREAWLLVRGSYTIK